MCSQSPVVYSAEYCYHQKNHCHFSSGLQSSFTLSCFLQSCYVNISLCLFKFCLPGRKACTNWRQKSDIIFNFSVTLLLILLSLKMECYHFPLLPSYLPVAVKQEPGPDCYCEKQMVDVVKDLFFTHFYSVFLDASCHKLGGTTGQCTRFAYQWEPVCVYSQSEHGLPGWSLFFQLT